VEVAGGYPKTNLVGGFNPSENGKIKNVPNHQPEVFLDK